MLIKTLNPIKILKSFTPVILFNFQEQEVSVENHVWITARRQSIPVRSMTTSHINNCIACLEGKGNMTIPEDYLGGKEKWLKIFNEELIKRQ